MTFDELFSEQVFEKGKIEEGRLVQRFLKRTRQALLQDWLLEMVKGMLRHFIGNHIRVASASNTNSNVASFDTFCDMIS